MLKVTKLVSDVGWVLGAIAHYYFWPKDQSSGPMTTLDAYCTHLMNFTIPLGSQPYRWAVFLKAPFLTTPGVLADSLANPAQVTMEIRPNG